MNRIAILILGSLFIVSIVCVNLEAGEQQSGLNIDLIQALENFKSDKRECDSFYRTDIMTVQGEASQQVPPELAIISFSVETLDKLASNSLSINSQSVNNAIADIKNLGIDEKEISTSGLSIYPEYESIYESNINQYKSVFKGYQVNNSINIRTKVLDQVGQLIDAAVQNGVNRVDNISFDAKSDTQQKIKDELLSQAVIDARTKAMLALEPLGMEIQSVKAVNINTGNNNVGFVNNFSKASFGAAPMADSAEGTSVFAGSETISVTVNVSFIIGTQN